MMKKKTNFNFKMYICLNNPDNIKREIESIGGVQKRP